METLLPIEEVAQQRLNLMVLSYSLFIKHLMEEGVDREKVAAASDRVWEDLGSQAGRRLKTLLTDVPKSEGALRAGAIATEIHGMTVEREPADFGHRSTFKACPWQEAVQALKLPEPWRLCVSGHAAFTRTMFETLYPGARVELEPTMPGGAAACEERVVY